ncbi:hypothetical protein ACFFRR_004812 [Megaselia abdita]
MKSIVQILLMLSLFVAVSLAKPDICHLPLKAGNPESKCDLQLPRWYYNENRNECFVFFYSGCHGNENNFKSKEICMKKCGDSRVIKDEDEVQQKVNTTKTDL